MWNRIPRRSRLYAAFLVRLSLLSVCLPATCDYIAARILVFFQLILHLFYVPEDEPKP
ncbi:hypothetical protein ANACOL_00291 [Anaerotruncus colihominis DSM 17241]|uniref:Uncharacterized protein n=1 Tax=Anaerotruncus colihominis DSM 17241 TaxID=445972 RepID=B0P6B9_9FIRM|nr:hypothetical protein ANACOL_00291 [Anaerotruncus colihominis DSM 17241]